MNVGVVAKAIVAFLTTVGTWAATALLDGHITTSEWYGLIGVAAAALGVYAAPNSGTSLPPLRSLPAAPVDATNPFATEAGYTVVGFIGVVLAIVGLILVVIGAIHSTINVFGVVLLIIGIAIVLLFDRARIVR